jgi:beta-lactamase regulating signal transducer with metallopeptidase domain
MTMSDLLPDTARLWHALGWTMIHFLWTGTALWVLLAVIRRSLRRRSPQERYAASLLALGGCAVLACGLGARLITHGALLTPVTAAHTGALPVPVESPASRTTQLEFMELYRQLLAGSPADAAAAAPPRSDDLATVVPLMHSAAGWLPWLWLCGTPLIAALFGTGIIGTFRLRLGSRPASEAGVHAMFAQLQEAMRISRRVTLTISDQVASPIVIGVLRPMIVLPPALLTGLAPAQIEMVLLHELAHVRRWDNFFNLAQRVVEAALFYHPAVWWTSRWVRLEREHCCDAVVLAHGRDPQAYAETLASLALPELSPQYAVAAMANHQLVARIRHILNVEEQGMRLTRSPIAWSGVLLLIAAGALTFGHLAGAQERPVEAPVTDEPAGALDTYSAVIHDYYDLLVQEAQSEDSQEAETAGEPVVQSLDLTYPAAHLELALALDAPAWSALQATGAPNVEQGGDNPHAWAPLTQDDQPEWLELEWTEPVRAAAILVYESFNPGALVRVRVNGDDIQETTIFEGADPVHVSEGKGVAIIPVTVDAPIKYVRLEFDSPAVPGWNQVDAVGLVELVSGEVHWAVGAQASSTYADRVQIDHAGEVLSLEVVRLKHGDRLEALCLHCHKAPHAEHLAPQQCPELIRSLEMLRGDRRQRIETLKQELQRLEQEEAAEQQQQSILHDLQIQLERQTAEQPEATESQRIRDYEEAYRSQARAEEAEREAMRLRDLLKLREVEAISQAQAEAELARLQELIQARNREAAQQAEAADAAAAAAEQQAEMQKLYELWRQNVAHPTGEPIPALTGSESANDPTGSQKLLEDLTRSIQQQQQAIDRLAEILEALRMQLQPADPNQPEEPGAEGTGAGTSDYEGASDDAASDLLNYVDGAHLQDSTNDAAFLRGFLLDVRGLPPTPEEVQEFLDDPSELKRQELLERLKQLNLSIDDGAASPAEADPAAD